MDHDEYNEHNTKKPSSTQSGHPHKHQTNPTQLLSSAKLVAEAAKSTLRHDMEKVDKGRVAGAAADLLGAASHYGKLEEKSFGKYVEKAETYLHNYHSSHSTNTTASSGHHVSGASEGSGLHGSAQQHSGSTGGASGHGNSSSSSESGFGDYLKLAEGFLKKR